MIVRILISTVVAVVAGWIAILIASIGNYLKALFAVANGSFCFYVSPVSLSVAVTTAIIAFLAILSILSRR